MKTPPHDADTMAARARLPGEGRRSPPRTWGLLALLAVSGAGCSSETEGPQHAGWSSDAGSLPAECAEGNPFASEGCGGALRTLCRGQATEEVCAAQGPFSFDDGAYVFTCGWARVVGFADPETCTVGSVEGRCEAGITQQVACADPCADAQGSGLYASLVAIASDAELVEMPCLGGGILDGPVGEWTALSNQQGEERHAHSCGADLPPPPGLCACHAAACQAL